jgi:hypothetical protein
VGRLSLLGLNRFLKPSLVVGAWFLSLLLLYAAIVALDLYWNVPDWQPRWDSYGLLMVWCAYASAVLLSALAVLAQNKIGRVLAIFVTAALLALGIYLVPAEPLSPGFLGRETASPLWYRTGRAGLLSLPACCWAFGFLRGKIKTDSTRSLRRRH